MAVRRGTLLLLVLTIADASTATWWLLGMPSSYQGAMDLSPTGFKENCNRLNYLVEKQHRVLCPLSPNTLTSVGIGAKMGIDECQYQFRNSRWNCTTFGNTTSVFGGVLAVKSRETAYVYAVSAAGAAYAVTRACSRGELNECTCENRERTIRLKEEREMKARNEGKLANLKLRLKEIHPKKNKEGSLKKNKDENSPTKPKKSWKWGGCSEDIHYGEEFSRKFVDARENRETAEGLMNIHNNEAGRRTIRTRMQRVCKCHGMSGSCSMRVCWRKLPQFRQVGDALKARFEGASHVKVVDKRRHLSVKKLKAVSRDLKPPNRTDLVYLDESPDYCERNDSLGVLGTRRRLCNRTSIGLDGCQLLCCGRGYQTRVRDVEEKCRCRFVWCCNVVCEICRYKKEEHICN